MHIEGEYCLPLLFTRRRPSSSSSASSSPSAPLPSVSSHRDEPLRMRTFVHRLTTVLPLGFVDSLTCASLGSSPHSHPYFCSPPALPVQPQHPSSSPLRHIPSGLLYPRSLLPQPLASTYVLPHRFHFPFLFCASLGNFARRIFGSRRPYFSPPTL